MFHARRSCGKQDKQIDATRRVARTNAHAQNNNRKETANEQISMRESIAYRNGDGDSNRDVEGGMLLSSNARSRQHGHVYLCYVCPRSLVFAEFSL